MKCRVLIATVLIAAILFLPADAHSPIFTSPLDDLELCTGWPYMPHPDYPECEYFDECICWMKPVDVKPIMSPLATVTHDGPETIEPKEAATYEQLYGWACFIAARWWGFDDSICTGDY